jgi:uncharacterized protein
MRNLILTGGPYHPFEETSRYLASLLGDEGIESEITHDAGALSEVESFDLFTLNLLHFRMLHERFEGSERDEWAMSLSPAARSAMVEHLGRGRGMVAMHAASVCFDDWPEWGEILGARWDWERSSHNAEPRLSKITVCPVSHSIVRGLNDFEVTDEIYTFLDYQPDLTPLLTSPRKSVEQPLLWAREIRGGRVVYDALGHDVTSLSQPTHREIVRRAARWALGDGR